MAASTALNRDDYRAIFLNDVPMMDVRAPVEFAQGAFPGVVNLPLMDDGERQQVGTCYNPGRSRVSTLNYEPERLPAQQEEKGEQHPRSDERASVGAILRPSGVQSEEKQK